MRAYAVIWPGKSVQQHSAEASRPNRFSGASPPGRQHAVRQPQSTMPTSGMNVSITVSLSIACARHSSPRWVSVRVCFCGEPASCAKPLTAKNDSVGSAATSATNLLVQPPQPRQQLVLLSAPLCPRLADVTVKVLMGVGWGGGCRWVGSYMYVLWELGAGAGLSPSSRWRHHMQCKRRQAPAARALRRAPRCAAAASRASWSLPPPPPAGCRTCPPPRARPPPWTRWPPGGTPPRRAWGGSTQAACV